MNSQWPGCHNLCIASDGRPRVSISIWTHDILKRFGQFFTSYKIISNFATNYVVNKELKASIDICDFFLAMGAWRIGSSNTGLRLVIPTYIVKNSPIIDPSGIFFAARVVHINLQKMVVEVLKHTEMF